MDIYELFEHEGGSMGWYAKGHHDPGDFALAIHAYTDGGSMPDPAWVRHALWRCVPVGERGRYAFYEAKAPGRGVFPVTVYEG